MVAALPQTRSVPSWEDSWPGRFDRELDDLRNRGIVFQVHDGPLAKGDLVIDLEWNGRRGALRLRAVYPDGFPWFRPMVFMMAKSEDLPARHCSPVDGQLCLLGRDTRQWDPLWTLKMLLDHQLDDALSGMGDEDPQGEPMEFWWNSLVDLDNRSFCLVDSDWAPPDGASGSLVLRCHLDRGGHDPVFRAYVSRLITNDGDMPGLKFPIPELQTSIDVPWVHLQATPAPDINPAVRMRQVERLIQEDQTMMSARRHKFGADRDVRVFAFSYPMETGHGVMGVGWLFCLSIGGMPGPNSRGRLYVVPTMRAGRSDLLVRNPEARRLAGKRIALVGVGAIGAPIALELARNGCSKIHLLDHDKVEPGNMVRWVGGPAVWGMGKAAALKALIGDDSPGCEIVPHALMLGTGINANPGLEHALGDCDLVIDASASYAVTHLLAASCRKRDIPLVSAMATVKVDGGAVAAFPAAGACPRCLEHAQFRDDVPQFGSGLDDLTLQPAGCSERTFEGAGYDLKELSLQTVRMALAALRGLEGSMVATLRFQDDVAGIRLPRWDLHPFGTYEKCCCRRS